MNHERPSLLDGIHRHVNGHACAVRYRVDLENGNDRLSYVSEDVESMTGFSVLELQDRSDLWQDLILTKERRRGEDIAGRVSPEASEFSVCYEGKHKHGLKRWFFNSAKTIFDLHHRPIAREGILLDVTRQRQREAMFDIANVIFEGLAGQHGLPAETAKYELVLQHALEKTIAVTDISSGFICEVGGEGGELKIRTLAECSGDDAMPPAVKDSLIQMLLVRKEAFFENESLLMSDRVFSVMGIPLVYNNTVIGAVGFVCIRDFEQDDVQLLRPIAIAAGVLLADFHDKEIRRRSETRIRDLNQALKQFKFALHSTSIVSITDVNGVIKYANKNFSAISQYGHVELIGKKHNIINSGHFNRSFWKDMWGKIIRGEIWRGDIKNRAKDGSYYWVDTFIVPVKDTTGRVVEFMSIRYDITKRKSNEEKLRLLSMVASETSNYVVIVDMNQTVQWINRSFEEAVGYSLEEIRDKRLWAFLYGKETSRDTAEFVFRMLELGESFQCEIVICGKSRDGFWVRMNFQPLKDEEGKITGFFGIMTDIEEEKRLIKSLDEARKSAEESDHLKSAFIANFSHEVRTPMNAIMGVSELLDKPNLTELKKGQLTRLIRERSRDLLSIVNDVLAISRIEAANVTSVETFGNVHIFLTQLYMGFSEQVKRWKKNIDVRMYCGLAKNEGDILADFRLLKEVFDVLLSNALKFTDAGSIVIGCDRQDVKVLRFVVSDTGKGIPLEKQEIIFKPFRQADATIHGSYGGTGLGLAIANGYVKLLGGQISVESNGRGSTFYFTLPYRRT